ncbi:hypothetical protein NMY22_g3897 [Coprinellus aureogranulatus]|nr:hypothetical protein NMY22_g3897 [Coprinellus aureogranulatus]
MIPLASTLHLRGICCLAVGSWVVVGGVIEQGELIPQFWMGVAILTPPWNDSSLPDLTSGLGPYRLTYEDWIPFTRCRYVLKAARNPRFRRIFI